MRHLNAATQGRHPRHKVHAASLRAQQPQATCSTARSAELHSPHVPRLAILGLDTPVRADLLRGHLPKAAPKHGGLD